MKYNQFNNKEQEISNDLFTDAFGSILGVSGYTSVVNPLLIKMPESKGNNRPESTFLWMSDDIHAIRNLVAGVSDKAFIS
ncbi:hypothetical protein [Aquimarina sp. MMG016]|uniref:hypothetical protein n=1 Tax=Aquimarina sp. MMG016 TaxID=2822690 RepID=UPI001B3A74C3|nr:hypothetical protein [Aquimarina sp. MMG016]MBQ4820735.1 hypothetical protein [Aquimarina sp. MMG016]